MKEVDGNSDNNSDNNDDNKGKLSFSMKRRAPTSIWNVFPTEGARARALPKLVLAQAGPSIASLDVIATLFLRIDFSREVNFWVRSDTLTVFGHRGSPYMAPRPTFRAGHLDGCKSILRRIADTPRLHLATHPFMRWLLSLHHSLWYHLQYLPLWSSRSSHLKGVRSKGSRQLSRAFVRIIRRSCCDMDAYELGSVYVTDASRSRLESMHTIHMDYI